MSSFFSTSMVGMLVGPVDLGYSLGNLNVMRMKAGVMDFPHGPRIEKVHLRFVDTSIFKNGQLNTSATFRGNGCDLPSQT